MTLKIADDKLLLVQVMDWCRQATIHYLSQCWHRSLSPYGETKLQHVKQTFSRINWEVVNQFVSLLTHWGRDQIDAISPTTFSNAFSRMKMNEFRVRFHWSLSLGSNNIPALGQIMVWRRTGDKRLSEPMMASLLTYMRHSASMS